MREITGQGPDKTLNRGFAIVRNAMGKPITSLAQAAPDQHIEIQFRDGTTLEDAHQLAHRLRDAIQAEIPDSDVLIHVEPEGALHDPETRETQPYRAG